jgi:hypothetical protein
MKGEKKMKKMRFFTKRRLELSEGIKFQECSWYCWNKDCKIGCEGNCGSGLTSDVNYNSAMQVLSSNRWVGDAP